jgi:hypothetical protein
MHRFERRIRPALSFGDDPGISNRDVVLKNRG